MCCRGCKVIANVGHDDRQVGEGGEQRGGRSGCRKLLEGRREMNQRRWRCVWWMWERRKLKTTFQRAENQTDTYICKSQARYFNINMHGWSGRKMFFRHLCHLCALLRPGQNWMSQQVDVPSNSFPYCVLLTKKTTKSFPFVYVPLMTLNPPSTEHIISIY